MKRTRPTPWFTYPTVKNSTKKVIIIGAGISGASTAYSLALRGYDVIVYERNHDVALEASGNYQGMLYGTFSAQQSPMQELSMLGYRYSLNLVENLLTEGVDYGKSGLCDLSYNDRELQKHQNLLRANYDFMHAIKQPELNSIAGATINCQQAIHFPQSVWLRPRNLIAKLLTNKNITINCNTNITKLEQDPSTLTWNIFGENNIILDQAQYVVLCNAHAVNQFEQTKHIPLRKIRGQISIIQGDIGLQSVICSDTYITPSVDGYFCCGATFKFNDDDLNIRLSEHQENINKMSLYVPQLATHMKNIDMSQIIGQANYRTTTTDYLPLVGPIGKYNEFMQNYGKLALDSNYWIETPCEYHEGLFLNVAHGAKGLLTAPICGEILASQIDAQNSYNPLLLNSLHPNRLWLKQIIKHQIA